MIYLTINIWVSSRFLLLYKMLLCASFIRGRMSKRFSRAELSSFFHIVVQVENVQVESVQSASHTGVN